MTINQKRVFLKDNTLHTDYNDFLKSILFDNISISIQELYNSNIIIYPVLLEDAKDLEKEQQLISKEKGKIQTYNYVGILWDNEWQVTINSRFYEAGSSGEDYFLMHMLATVFNYNVTDYQMGSSPDNPFLDLLVFMFPFYLEQAWQQGVYREYQQRHYHDRQLKGKLEIARHIRHNIPFTGKFTYSVRELTEDNPMLHLIRHTIEHLQRNRPEILSFTDETKQIVKQVRELTPSYNFHQRYKVIRQNKKKVIRHAYYERYRILQDICIKILEQNKQNTGDNSQEVKGILFNAAWLWENYIWVITEWKHYARNKMSKKLNRLKAEESPLYVFESGKSPRYPDFVVENDISEKIPIDTKYKYKIGRDDINQMLAYMYILEAKKGYFLRPKSEKNSEYKEVENSQDEDEGTKGELAGYGGYIRQKTMIIPQNCKTYKEFKEEIRDEEERLSSFYKNH